MGGGGFGDGIGGVRVGESGLLGVEIMVGVIGLEKDFMFGNVLSELECEWIEGVYLVVCCCLYDVIVWYLILGSML